jgi:XTP/dITP diphosphohydrolase
MKELIFASNNLHKLEEVRAILSSIRVKSLSEAGISEDIAETGNTLEQNAFIKANHIFRKTNRASFSDDTGLFVETLNGEPGIYSARFAGEGCSAHDNIVKLLSLMKGKENRNAYFKTVIYLIDKGKEFFFEGVLKGKISEAARGTNGFGYDPVFIPEGLNRTLAELPPEEKNLFSHRAIAVRRMRDYLNQPSSI